LICIVIMNGNNNKSVMTATKSFKMPSDFKLMDAYISQNKNKMMDHILTMIEKGIKSNYPVIELFHFEGTNYCVTLLPKEYKENLNNIFQYYLETEQYEQCSKLKDIEALLEKSQPSAAVSSGSLPTK